MSDIEIKKELIPFLKSMKRLQNNISDMFYNISIGEDRDDKVTRELFAVYKYLKRD